MSFRAYVAEQNDDDVDRGVRDLDEADLPEGDVTIRIDWSGVNYKDALATIPKGGVARIPMLVPGVDLAGTVTESSSDEFSEGDEVLVNGYDVGVAHHGGWAEQARVPAGWVVPRPDDLSARDAMIYGTAGYTAALSLHALEGRGLTTDDGPVLVAGACGGVGSTAVAILAQAGYEVVASTGRSGEHDWLRSLGAAEVIDREETSAESDRPLEKQRWAAAIDPVGGATTAYILRTLKHSGAVAISGLTSGIKLEATVLPFVLRGVAALGVDSSTTEIGLRRELWQRLADDLRPAALDEIAAREVSLDELDPVLDGILKGEIRGRTLVKLAG
jgi:acrylyl-CoA reductase (NADPH)